MWKATTRWLLAFSFVVAGWMHFRRPEAYLAIMPPVFPQPLFLIYLSGAAEIVGGAGLLLPTTRQWAAWGLVALLVCVFPANIYMLTARPSILGMQPPTWLLWLRLPFQALLIGVVLWVGLPRSASRKNDAEASR